MDTDKIVAAQFNDTFVPIMDGVGNVAKNYAYWLHKKYGTCCAVVPQVPKYEDDEEFPVLRFKSLPLPGKDPWRLGIPKLDPAIQKQLAQINFTILHTHCPFTSGELALKIAEERKIPLITTFHSKYREDFEKTFKVQGMIDWAMKKIMRFYKAADYIWVPNEGAKRELQSYGCTKEIEIMRNGTDLLAPDRTRYEEYRKRGLDRAAVPAGTFIMLFVGQHRWLKNIGLILDSAAILSQKKKDFLILFVGTGTDEGEIKRTVRQKKLAGNIKFLGRIIEREEIKELYAAADLFLFPSLYDTASLVMREAAAFSLPSILVEGASTAEGVTHGENGFISPNNAEAYAAMLTDLIDNPEKIRAAGAGARESIYQSWEKIVELVAARYLEIQREYEH